MMNSTLSVKLKLKSVMAGTRPEFNLEARYQRYTGLSGIHLSEMTPEQRYLHRRSFYMGCHTLMEVMLTDARKLPQPEFTEIVNDLRKQVLTALYSKHGN